MKLLCMLSGGIDSPVAAYLMKQKGCKVEAVHFQVSKSEKIEKLTKLLGVKLHIIPHSAFLKIVREKCDTHITCLLCKRRMLTESAKLAKELGMDAILTGDSLGQVASQTIDNLKAEQALIDIPIVRPLIGLNKQEVITIAKEIGTYELSITEAERCPFVPDKPATHASVEQVNEEWEKVK